MSTIEPQALVFHFDTTASIEAVVSAFEACSVPPNLFSHRAHLAVTLVYLLRWPEPQAEIHLRAALHRFIAHHGVDGYNETITEFWLRRVKCFLAGQDRSRPLPQLVAALLEQCGPSARIYDYFSKPRLSSPELRAQWGEPDLKPLDF